MRQKSWGIFASGILSGAAGSLLTQRFIKSYREEEIRSLVKKNDQITDDFTSYRKHDTVLASLNRTLLTEFIILSSRFDECQHQQRHSIFLWKATDNSSNKTEAEKKDPQDSQISASQLTPTPVKRNRPPQLSMVGLFRPILKGMIFFDPVSPETVKQRIQRSEKLQNEAKHSHEESKRIIEKINSTLAQPEIASPQRR
jgi:hypothetical protein